MKASGPQRSSPPLLKAALSSVFAVALLLAGVFFGRQTNTRLPASSADHKELNHLHFMESSQASGINFRHYPYAVAKEVANLGEWMSARGAAVAVADFNNDGFMDFYATSSRTGSPNGLYLNRGNGTFQDVAAKFGVADLNQGFNSMAALWFDFNNDGWADLYVVGMGCNKLFRNAGGKKFVEVTSQAGEVKGIPDEHGMCGSPSSVLAFDYNRDGLLDIFVSNTFVKDRRKVYNGDTWLLNPLPNKRGGGPEAYLFRNNGDGTFTNVARELGVANKAWAQAAGAGDVNGDGWPDLFVANDASPDRLFLSRKGTSFEDVTTEAFPGQYGRVGMSAEIVDIDGDGIPEIYSTKITYGSYMTGRNELWKGDGRHFRNVAPEAGVTSCGWSWNAKFLDIGHRGVQDLVVVNGLFSGKKDKDYWFASNSIRAMDTYLATDAKFWPAIKGASLSGWEKNCAFLRVGKSYVDRAKELGLNDEFDGRGLATIDVNNDGKQSLLIGNTSGPVLLYKNTSDLPDTDWIGFDLRVTSGRRSAVGAKVRVFAEGLPPQTLEVNAGNGYASQSDPRLVFGLGRRPAKVSRIEVSWPNGQKQELTGLNLNEYHKLAEPK